MIEKIIKENGKVFIAYLTSSSKDGKFSKKRELESLKVLKKLELMIKIFFTLEKTIMSKIYNYIKINLVFKKLHNTFMNINLDQLIIHSWEGGHPDHDTSHVIGFKLAKKLDLLDRTFQFPLYSGNKLYWYFFRLFDTSITKGEILVYKIPNLKKFKYLYLISYYKSQVKTFIGLFPIYLMHIIFFKIL